MACFSSMWSIILQQTNLYLTTQQSHSGHIDVAAFHGKESRGVQGLLRPRFGTMSLLLILRIKASHRSRPGGIDCLLSIDSGTAISGDIFMNYTIIRSLYLVPCLVQHADGRQKEAPFSSKESGTLWKNQVDLSELPQFWEQRSGVWEMLVREPMRCRRLCLEFLEIMCAGARVTHILLFYPGNQHYSRQLLHQPPSQREKQTLSSHISTTMDRQYEWELNMPF